MPYLPCTDCGIPRFTRADAVRSVKCRTSYLRKEQNAKWKLQLEEMGYDVTSSFNPQNSHSKITLTNHSCRHTYEVKINNVLSGRSKCAVCGPTKRAANALKYYMEKFAANYDIEEWKGYLLEARRQSDIVYKENIHILNPMGLPRCKPNKHADAVNLDHTIPIIEGFKRGVPVKILTDLRNLRIIPARENLKKKQSMNDEAEALLCLLLREAEL